MTALVDSVNVDQVAMPKPIRDRLRAIPDAEEALTAEKEAAIMEAHAYGCSLGSIAREARMSPSGVMKLVRRLSRSDDQ